MEIRYEKLNHRNFGGHSLDDFIRHHEIHECWRNIDGELKLVPNAFTEDWSVEKCREVAAGISCRLEKDLSAFGAFCGNRLVGFVTVEHEIFGNSAKHVNLEQFQVSQDFRGKGTGREAATTTERSEVRRLERKRNPEQPDRRKRKFEADTPENSRLLYFYPLPCIA